MSRLDPRWILVASSLDSRSDRHVRILVVGSSCSDRHVRIVMFGSSRSHLSMHGADATPWPRAVVIPLPELTAAAADRLATADRALLDITPMVMDPARWCRAVGAREVDRSPSGSPLRTPGEWLVELGADGERVDVAADRGKHFPLARRTYGHGTTSLLHASSQSAVTSTRL
jgi:hypothetical protein